MINEINYVKTKNKNKKDNNNIHKLNFDYCYILENINFWIKENIVFNRELNLKNLYIIGLDRDSKFKLMNEFKNKNLNIYNFPIFFRGFLDGYNDDYDIVLIQDFSTSHLNNLEFFINFISGNNMLVELKGSSFLKKKYIPILIFADFSFEFIFKKKILSYYNRNLCNFCEYKLHEEILSLNPNITISKKSIFKECNSCEMENYYNNIIIEKFNLIFKFLNYKF